MTDLETIFAKLAGLIEGAEKSEPREFYLELPAAEWRAAEESLLRSPAVRKWQHNHFVWRGEVVTRGSKWAVHGVDHV